MNFFNMLSVYYHDYLVSSKLFTILTDAYFHRLKINQDYHEFILESDTYVNTSPLKNSRREQSSTLLHLRILAGSNLQHFSTQEL
jgi:hypothetical protein